MEELLSRSEKVTDVEYSSEKSIERYFTRERVRKMLQFITTEPDNDATKERGKTIPFHSDMIFRYNKKPINAIFFQDESQDARSTALGQTKSDSPQQMIDVFMTPQSDDDFSDDSLSPPTSDPNSSPTDAVA